MVAKFITTIAYSTYCGGYLISGFIKTFWFNAVHMHMETS